MSLKFYPELSIPTVIVALQNTIAHQHVYIALSPSYNGENIWPLGVKYKVQDQYIGLVLF